MVAKSLVDNKTPMVHKLYHICIKMESAMSKIMWSTINKHTMPKKKKKKTSLHNKQKVTSPENYQIFFVDTRQKNYQKITSHGTHTIKYNKTKKFRGEYLNNQ